MLVIGHPGHELRVWGWVTSRRPLVSILTDGSGSTGHPRLEVTRASLERAGARPEAPFGTLNDQAVYTALLTGEYAPLLAVAQDLSDTIVARQVIQVASDAVEGYNPTHDICGLIAGAAIDVAASRGQAATALEFAVTHLPASDPALPSGGHRLELTDDGLAEKVELARSYARSAGPMLEEEVETLLARHGQQRFRTETLVPRSRRPLADRFAEELPFYETHGERRVREGKYGRVLRLREHLLPFERRLAEWVQAGR
jgi:hypothetical protein